MQEDLVNTPDDNASFQSIYKAISISFDESNPYHQNLVRCLFFMASEEKVDKAEAMIPEEIKAMICEAVQEILKEFEPEPESKLKLKPKLNSERKRTEFSQRLEEEWLPNLPKFLTVVPKLKPKPVPLIKATHQKTTQPLSPKESAISPKQPSENPVPAIKAQHVKMIQPLSPKEPAISPKQPSEPSTNIKQLDRRASVPEKNKKKGFFNRYKPKVHEERNEDITKNQSQSF